MWGILLAIAVGAAIVVLGVILTVQVIRTFRKRHNTKMLIADMEKYIQNMPDKEKHSISLDELESLEGQKIISEFDPYTNEIVQTKICDKGFDSNVEAAVDKMGGYIIVGD